MYVMVHGMVYSMDYCSIILKGNWNFLFVNVNKGPSWACI